jgi:plastocyanin
MARSVGARNTALKSFGLLGLLALLGVAVLPGQVSAASAASRNWKLTVGAQTHDQGIQANAFLPHDASVNVGDTITWTVATGEFHTVTFLSGGPRPPFIAIGPNGPDLNPVAVTPAGGATYSGSGFFNSGLLVQGQTYMLGFSQSGEFQYVCLVHSEMKGTLHVKSAGTRSRQTQALVDIEGRAEAARLIGQGIGLEGRGLAAALRSGRGGVTAGIGKLIPGVATLAVVRFEPETRVAHVGDTVTWSNLDPEFPHTITFGTEPSGGPFGAFAPSGVDAPGHATLASPGQSVNSGFIGADLPFGTQFRATFTAPGTYTYICALHDQLGMVGTIQVVRR